MTNEILKKSSMNPRQGLMVLLIISMVVLGGCQTDGNRSGNYSTVNAKQSDVDACNANAEQAAGKRGSTTEIAKDAAIGGVGGAGVGAVGGAIGGSAGKGAGIGAVVGLTAGTLYGLNENRKNDEVYQDSYRRCMQNKGY